MWPGVEEELGGWLAKTGAQYTGSYVMLGSILVCNAWQYTSM